MKQHEKRTYIGGHRVSYEIKRKKRTYTRWDRIIAVAMIPLVLAGLYSAVVQEPIQYEDTTVVVKEGDTLWGIAKDAVGEKVDVRQSIREIITENNLDGANIHPGMTLKVRAIKEAK